MRVQSKTFELLPEADRQKGWALPVAKISSVGCYVPSRVLTNQDLSRMVETNDKWIVERTGIRERRIADPDIATSDMAIAAARQALEARGIEAADLDAIILCTVTPDMQFPSTACLVQDQLGAHRAWGFDLAAACCGFLYGITTAAQLVSTGAHRYVLVIGSDTMSRIIDYQDRSTCILFGDGAGAFLIEPSTASDGFGYIGHQSQIDGSGAKFLRMPAGGSRHPASAETVAKRLHYVKQDGQQVFKFAVRKMQEMCEELLARHGFCGSDVKLLIPHQANRRIITATAERLGLPLEKVIINLDKYGNTTAGTIPLATQDALCGGKLKKGDLVLFAAVGAGYTAGASLWRWSY
ncbi:MAG: ketoacyl-ACP synthase III [Acidobacteriaceae bacterium]|nr:ketoacyl-ACP synthase III [Acidobacteriaceae bacterium]